MNEFLNFLLWGFIGYFLGKVIIGVYRIYLAMKAVAVMKNLEERLEEQQMNIKIIEAEIEKHNEEYFVYNKHDKNFMAQGKDYNVIQERLRARFPGYNILVDEAHMKEVGLEIGNSGVDSPPESVLK